jgi:hypothetical protein
MLKLETILHYSTLKIGKKKTLSSIWVNLKLNCGVDFVWVLNSCLLNGYKILKLGKRIHYLYGVWLGPRNKHNTGGSLRLRNLKQ